MNTNKPYFISIFIPPIYAILLLAISSIHLSAQETRYVSPSGGHTDPYTSWETAATTIWAAVSAANSNDAGDTVWITNGHYMLDTTIVVSNVRVRGWSGDPADVIVDGNATYRCFHLRHTNSGLFSVTVTNGFDESGFENYGAGVLVDVPEQRRFEGVVISNCVITGNTIGGVGVIVGTGSGGISGRLYIYDTHIIGNTLDGIRQNSPATNKEIYLYNSHIGGNTRFGANFSSGAAILTNCYIYNNGAQGIYASGYTLDIYNSVITNNFTDLATYGSTFFDGGGIFKSASRLRLSHSLVADNQAQARGGGVYVQPNQLYIINSVIRDNECIVNISLGDGGGLYILQNALSGDTRIENTLFVGNNARRAGGGVLITGADDIVEFYNCTIAGNTLSTADAGGAGVWLASRTNRFYNTIIYSNTFDGTPYDLGYLVDDNYFYNSCSPDLAEENGNITNSPAFASVAAGNYRLTSGSPCVNTGVNQEWMENAVDLDGNPRIFNHTVDMGCYEYRFRGAFFNTW